jgi:hypothetical protein
MSENKRTNKPRYESPVALPLGEMAKGSGDCSTGSVVTVGLRCSDGNKTSMECLEGGAAGVDCTEGGAAGVSCTGLGGAAASCTLGLVGLGAEKH